MSSSMDLQPARQFEYLQRTLTLLLAHPSDMFEQFDRLLDELIGEHKQSGKSPKTSPEPSDSKPDLLAVSTTSSNSPQPLPKKRSSPAASNTKPPPHKRLKTSTPIDDDDDEPKIVKKKKILRDDDSHDEEENVDRGGEDESSDENKSKRNESQTNVSSSGRHIDEFAIELGLVCNKCMVLTEETDNRLVECHECHAKYHQKCHKPTVSTTEISDPRCLWYCSKCRRLITKRQQPQVTNKEIKTNSNAKDSSPSIGKPKSGDGTLSIAATKKVTSTPTSDVTSGLFSFKAKSSDVISSNNIINHNNPSSITSTTSSSLPNGIAAKNSNAWVSLATGFKEKKAISEATSAVVASASSILADLNALTAPNSITTKRSPPSFNSLARQTSSSSSSSNNNTSMLKSTSGSSLPLGSTKPTSPSPAMFKTQLSSSSLKSTTKLLPSSSNNNKIVHRLGSPTPLGRPLSVVKSPSPSSSPISTTYTRLNSSGSNSSGSNSPSSANSTNTKIATGFDFEKRLKQMKKMAAEKSLTKKF